MRDEEFEDEEKTSPWLIGAGVIAIIVFIGLVAFWGLPKLLGHLANEGTIPPPPPPAVAENAPPTLDLVSPSGDLTIEPSNLAIVVLITDDGEDSMIEVTSQIGELTPELLAHSDGDGGQNNEWVGTANFTTPGVYKLTISATDNDGAKTSRAVTVTVNAAEQPVVVTTPEPAPVPVEATPPVEEPTPAPEAEPTATERKVIGKTISMPGIGELFVTDDRAYVLNGAKTVDVACLAQVGGSMTPVALRGEGCTGVTARCLPLPADVVQPDGKERVCPKSAKPVAPATKPAAEDSVPAPTGTTTSTTTPAAAKPLCYVNGDPENDAWRCDNANSGALHVESLNGVPNYTVGP